MAVGMFVMSLVVIAFFAKVLATRKCAICHGPLNKATSMVIPLFDGIRYADRPYADKALKRACEKCQPGVREILHRHNEMITRAEVYETWPATYRGKVPMLAGSDKAQLTSDRHRGKESAKNQLIMTSAWLYPDCNAITGLKFSSSEDSEGNYRFTVWSASGVPCVIRKRS